MYIRVLYKLYFDIFLNFSGILIKIPTKRDDV